MRADLLERLEEWKSRFGGDASELEGLLAEAEGQPFADAPSLIRLHECLLFLRAYPANARVKQLADRLLFSFGRRIAGDLEAFEDPTVSGIAGTSLSAVFSFEVARRLYDRYPRQIAIDWENYEHTDKLGPVLRRFLPLIAEDWPVEAHPPYRQWMEAAHPRQGSDLGWLLDRLRGLPDGADLYDSLELLLVWKLGNGPATRSRLRLPVRKIFFHDEPLIRRSDVSLAQEMEGPPLPIERLSRTEGRKLLDIILDTSAMRYRELYGFTHPDTGRIFRADAGRGVEVYFFGVPAEWRLPLRAYHAGMFFKNGVPAGYVEVLSIFERAEVGFNLYYTFREGETAWLYARLLHLFRQVLGVTYFSVDPYQVGLENDEALDSGAFWFYRKLGFRPLDREVARLVEREERRMRKTPGYRSSRRTLEKLARSYVLYESPGCEPGVWDQFRVRNVALALTRGAAGGRAVLEELTKAKQGTDEAGYLRRIQRNPRLRQAVLRLGLH